MEVAMHALTRDAEIAVLGDRVTLINIPYGAGQTGMTLPFRTLCTGRRIQGENGFILCV